MMEECDATETRHFSHGQTTNMVSEECNKRSFIYLGCNVIGLDEYNQYNTIQSPVFSNCLICR